MKLWSLHPQYLDRQGLLGLWREGLLAQKVLMGKTNAYQEHPQLERFKKQKNSLGTMATYLFHIWKEAHKREYNFDKSKNKGKPTDEKIKVTTGQLEYEWEHLKNKLKKRAPEKYRELLKIKKPEAHPLFTVKEGPVEEWEKI